MYYVYSEDIKTGKINLIRTFCDRNDALAHIAQCYKIDMKCYGCNEWYYYMKQR